MTTHHWYVSVLNKQFLTPFRNGIWNRRQVSVGYRGSFPHDPETIGICPSGTHARQNEVMCDRRALKYGNTYNRAKKYNYTGKIIPGRKYIPHIQSPLNVSIRMYIPHNRSKENVSVHRYITHNFSC